MITIPESVSDTCSLKQAVRFLWETWTPGAFVHLRAEGPEVQVPVTSAA